MKLGFRWYGLNDSIPLEYIGQIPNMHTVVTALYDSKPGEKWDETKLKELKKYVEDHNLKMEVIESIPVPEGIKYGAENRDELIDNFIYNLRLVAKYGVKCVCYNFMPVFDWLRTTMHHVNKDGSDSLAYIYEDFLKVDPKHLHLPGWDESYTESELQELMNRYQHMTHEDLFNNIVYFLNKVIPVCEEVDVNLAIHPDDPPWDIFSLPRIISSEADLDRLFKAVPSKRNGLTLCTGSLGAGRDNDIVHLDAGFLCCRGLSVLVVKAHYQHAFRHVQGLGDLCVHGVHIDSQTSLLVLRDIHLGLCVGQVVDDVHGFIDGDGIANALYLGVCHLGYIDANELSLHVQKGSAGVSGVDGRVYLDQVGVRSFLRCDLTVQGGNIANGYGLPETKGITDGDDALTRLQVFRVMQAGHLDLVHGALRHIRQLYCHDGQVHGGIGALDGCIHGFSVDEGNGDLTRILHYVVVGHDQKLVPRLLYNNTGARCLRHIFLGHAAAIEVIEDAAVALLLNHHFVGDADHKGHGLLNDV